MLFNSIEFVAFFLSVSVVCYFLPVKYRTVFLVLASFYLYGYHHPEYLLIIIFSILLNFFIGVKMENSLLKHSKAVWFCFGLSSNIAFLFFFKHYFFFSHNLNELFTAINLNVAQIILPLGISFYTLQNIAYITDIYRGNIHAEKNIEKFTLFVAFFPKIIAGPIESATKFLPQVHLNKKINYDDINIGLQRILIGFFKKMVLADRLAVSVNAIYDSPDAHAGLTVLIATYLFAFQLYFDFSGYTDIALGTAKILGYDLTENFKLPLRAKSISEFWRKWHISLSQWFFNYLYYPLVYSLRKWKKGAIIIAISVTFFLSGMWHGIGLNFVIWGALHAIYLTFELVTKKQRLWFSKKIPSVIYNPASIIITFNLICLTKIFFRSGSADNAFNMLNAIFSCSNFFPDSVFSGTIATLAAGGDLESLFNFILTIILLIGFLIMETKIIDSGEGAKKNNYFIKLILLLLIILFGVFQSGNQFVYVRF